MTRQNAAEADELALVEQVVHSADGRALRLGELLAGRHLLVYFMRTFDCPICRGHVRALRTEHAGLRDAGADIVVVGPGTEAEAQALAERYPGLPFPVVADVDGAAYRAAGLRKAVFGAIQQSGTVLLAPDGAVRLVHSATVPVNALNMGAIRAALAESIRAAA